MATEEEIIQMGWEALGTIKTMIEEAEEQARDGLPVDPFEVVRRISNFITP